MLRFWLQGPPADRVVTIFWYARKNITEIIGFLRPISLDNRLFPADFARFMPISLKNRALLFAKRGRNRRIQPDPVDQVLKAAKTSSPPGVTWLLPASVLKALCGLLLILPASNWEPERLGRQCGSHRARHKSCEPAVSCLPMTAVCVLACLYALRNRQPISIIFIANSQYEAFNSCLCSNFFQRL